MSADSDNEGPLSVYAVGMGMGMGMGDGVGMADGMGAAGAGMNDPRRSGMDETGLGMRAASEAAGSLYSPYGADLLSRHEWRHTVYLVEFLMATKWQEEIGPVLGSPFPDDSPETKDEIDSLIAHMGSDEQGKYYDEILGQNVDFVGCFEQLAFFDANSHPVTSNLVQTMVLIGWTVVQYYKEFYGRPRPSVLNAKLIPIIRVPAFPAYPSGHSTQAHLIMHALLEVARGDNAHLSAQLQNLAERIGTNRELAGVHYRSDTSAGQRIAKKIWELAGENRNFRQLIAEAKAEWNRPLQSGRKFLNH
jgi:acid phosphatase (class A)